MRFVLVTGTTATARIDGISAAGASPALLAHTPAADAEILTRGRPRGTGVVPVSPTGCPTPAVVTRAGRELLGFDVDVIDAGAARPVDVADHTVSTTAGLDVREPVALPSAENTIQRAREYGRSLDDDHVVLAETVPGGTTTAMATLAALGERTGVSSSLPDNPVERKRRVVDAALDASGLDPGDGAGAPRRVLRAVGDPALAGVTGVALGVVDRGGRVTLAGGTQMCAVAALVRAFGVDAPLSVATTSFVARDDSADVRGLAADLDVDLAVTDPRFDAVSHPMTDAYRRGEAKEGVGMGGVLAMAAGTVPGAERAVAADSDVSSLAGVSVADVRDRALDVYDRLLATAPEGHPAVADDE
ncbi:nicotinate mononucleotide-dependent phosphoribosyltransferase CobT [Halorubrum sp. DTA98]|uniref:nicotinate mononucleotide-dependent phosphoribosyltransferase CobT n=1 Tax=Halorubrum sp. DTA98 TaxID=3402163 RepID=UPI003AACB9D9